MNGLRKDCQAAHWGWVQGFKEETALCVSLEPFAAVRMQCGAGEVLDPARAVINYVMSKEDDEGKCNKEITGALIQLHQNYLPNGFQQCLP